MENSRSSGTSSGFGRRLRSPEKGALAVELGEFYVKLFGPDVVFVTLVQDDKSPQRLPALTDRISLGIVHLKAQSESDRYHVAIRVSEAAVPLAEFGQSEPVIQAVLSFNPTQNTLEFPDEGQLDVRFWFPSTPTDLRHPPPFEAHRYRPNLEDNPVSFIVPNECDSDVACELELILRFATTGPNSSFEGPVELEPTLDVLIAYPITDRVPERADLEVALEHRA